MFLCIICIIVAFISLKWLTSEQEYDSYQQIQGKKKLNETKKLHESSFFNQSHRKYFYIYNLTTQMSRSHKNFIDTSLISITKKKRQPSCSRSKKKCSEKENIDHSTSISKFKQDTGKKQNQKKFLQEQLQKIKQKRRIDSDSKKKSIKESNRQELFGMKEDLQQIKEVIAKLVFDQKTNKKEQQKEETDDELHMICIGYRRKISQIEEDLSVQKMANAQLEEAHIQSQVYAQQTKDLSESIKRQLQELASKHIKCQENAIQLEQARRAIKILNTTNSELEEIIQDHKSNNQQRAFQIQKAMNNLNEVNKENQQLRLALESAAVKISKLQQCLNRFEVENEEIGEQIQKQSVKGKSFKQDNLGLKKIVQQLYEQNKALQKAFQVKENALKIENKRFEVQNNDKTSQIQRQLIRLKSLDQEYTGFKIRVKQLQDQKQALQKDFQVKESELHTQIINLQNGYKQLIEQKDIISQAFLEKIDTAQLNLKNANDENRIQRQQNDRLIYQVQNLTKKIEKERNSLDKSNSLRLQLYNTQIELSKPSSIIVVDGLVSMQQKCSQLYQQIRKEKMKWDLLNNQTHEQKKNFENQLQYLANQRQSISIQLKSYQCSLGQSLKITQILRVQKQNQERQIISLKSEISLIKQQKQSLNLQLHCQVNKKKENQSQILAYKMKSYELEQKFKAIQQEKESLLVFKNSHLITVKAFDRQISDLKGQVCKLQENKKNLGSQVKQIKQLLQNKTIESTKQQLELKDFITKNNNLQQQKKMVQADWKKTKQAHINAIKQKEQLTLQLIKLEEAVQKTERQNIIKQQKHSLLQIQLEAQRDQYAAWQKKLAQMTDSRLQLQQQLSKLTDSTKRSSSQLQRYEKQIAFKNKSIFELKETIKLVKEQSIRIKEQVQVYKEEYRMMNQKIQVSEQANKFEDLIVILQKQIEYMKERMDGLNFDKEDIQLQIRKITDENIHFKQKINILQNVHQDFVHKGQYQAIIQRIQESLAQQIQKSQNKTQQINPLQSKIQAQQEKILQLQLQIQSYSEKINELSVSNSKLINHLLQKDESIIKFKQSYDNSNEERNVKAARQIKSIQSRIEELEQKNRLLESENKQLRQKLSDSLISLNIYQRKIEVLAQNQKALEQQSQLFKLETARSQQIFTKIQQKKLRQLRETYENNQIRTTEQINILKESTVTLKETIQQLANELTISIDKLNAKNEQIQKIKLRYGEIQSVLKQNHELLYQQREQREKISAINSKLNLCIQNYKLQIVTKGKEAESLTKQKSILKSKLVELQSKYEILHGKYKATEQQKLHAKKQIENQTVTLRVLREQNKNIQKVLSDQLNQRKAIIEQLVNQKKILYQQLKN